MSLVEAPLAAYTSLDQLSQTRKRTSSFSYPTCTALTPNPRPTKAARMGAPLRRQETVLLSPQSHSVALTLDSATPSTKPTTAVPYYRTLQYYKEQREKRKAVLNRNGEPITISTTRLDDIKVHQPQQRQPSPQLSVTKPTAALRPRKSATVTTQRSAPAPKAPTQVILPSAASPITVTLTRRSSSPLSPNPTPRPGRPVFPRSKPEPDLYRVALCTRWSNSPGGRQMLLMGPRHRFSLQAATQELARIVAGQQERDGDVVMADSTPQVSQSHSSLAMPVLTASWVVVKGDDWEMVDCAV